MHVAAETVLREAALLAFEVVGQAQGAEEVERVQVVVLALATSYSKLFAPQH